MPAASNPVIGRVHRGGREESIHRGTWVLVDTLGTVVDGRGDPDQHVFARSSTKSIQALPLFESGAADALDLTDAEIAVAVASHNGEHTHVEAARRILARIGLDETHLRCGPQRPAGTGNDAEATRITNNCSGKHAAFLATALQLGDDPARYLEPDSTLQRRVHQAMLDMTGTNPGDVRTAIDGCSAPTFGIPLRALATGLARMANPDTLGTERRHACERIVRAAGAHPELVGGSSTPRFDTDLLRASGGRLFSKNGAEGVQTVGIVGAGLGFAAKADDGSKRALRPLTLAVLERLGLIAPEELESLDRWTDRTLRNFDGLNVGHLETCEDVLPSGE